MNFKKCPNCEVENPATEIYCLDCGTKLEPEKRPARPSTPAGTPPAAPTAPAEPAPSGPGPARETSQPEGKQKVAPAAEPEEKPAASQAPASHSAAGPAPAPKNTSAVTAARRAGRGFPFIPPGAPRLILAAAVFIILAAVVWRLASRPGRSAPAESAPDKISVAVLPFAEPDRAPALGYFGEGAAAALCDGLSRLPGLMVIRARPSSSSRTATAADSAQVGRDLGAGYVLTGILRRGEGRLRLAAELVKAADGAKIWGDQFVHDPADLLGVLRELAGGLVQALHVPAPSGEVDALFATRALDPEACELFFHARSLALQGGKANLEKSVELFQQAGTKDPGWGDVPASLAGALIGLGSESLWSPGKAFPAARQAILKAMELDPGSGEARLALALLKWRSEWDLAGAERQFREALNAGPGQPEIRRSFALYLSSLGRHEEAQTEIKAALDLAPLSPRVRAAYGMVLYYARLYDQAAGELAKAREAFPSDPEACLVLGLLYIQTGDLGESLRMFQQAAALGGDPTELSLRGGVVLARLGRRQEVGQILNAAIRASSRTYVSSASLAAVYAGLMEPDQAQACLEKALAERDASLVFLKVSPLFDAVRSRPWFNGLLEKAGF